MILLIFSICIFLFSFILYLKTHQTKKQLLLLIKETTRILEENSEQVLLFQTDSSIVQTICISINELLSKIKQLKVDYSTTKMTLFHTLSNISHDIKTPIATSLGYIELLEKKLPNEHSIGKIKKKLLEMNTIIDQFSILSKLDAKDFLPSPKNININEFSRQILFSFEPILKKKFFIINISIPEKSIQLYSDSYILTSVIENLVNNALTHGSDGNYFSFTLKKHNENIVLTFTDRGKGIAKENFEHIFTRTFMENHARSTKSSGSGLGLAIVKEYLLLINGTVEVKSTPYVETTFTVTLPIRMDES